MPLHLGRNVGKPQKLEDDVSEASSIHHQSMTLDQYRRAFESAKAESEIIVKQMTHLLSMLPSPGFIQHADGTFERIETNLPPEFHSLWEALSDMRNQIYRKHGIEVLS